AGSWFFFSGRRRHTRCLSDWSSDVCSSDLPQEGPAELAEIQSVAEAARRDGDQLPCRPQQSDGQGEEARVQVTRLDARLPEQGRSEERRVGKECGSRRAGEH